MNPSDHMQFKYTGMVIIDPQKAFGPVDHHILCKTFEVIRVSNEKKTASNCKWYNIQFGRHEIWSTTGIYLGPSLFLYYANDIF